MKKSSNILSLAIAVSLSGAAFAGPVTESTRWGKVSPTNTLGQIMSDLDIAKKSDIGPGGTNVASNVALTNNTLYVNGDHINIVSSTEQGGVAIGNSTSAGPYSFATGLGSEALAEMSVAMGAWALASDNNSFVWSGVGTSGSPYSSKGGGTFSVNPVDGIDGFFIGDSTLRQHITNSIPDIGSLASTNYVNETFATKDELSSAIGNIDVNTNVVITIDNGILTVSTNGVALWSSAGGGGGNGRVAMFIVPINESNAPSPVYTGFELKASTNNFTAATENARLQFYSQSECADTGYGSEVDKMRLFICTNHDKQHVWHDNRSYVCISNTATPAYLDLPEGAEYPYRKIVAIVDTSCLVRNPETVGNAWLSEGNVNLSWRYTRDTTNDGPEKEWMVEQSPVLWQPIEPVRWFPELPDWAK